MILPPEYKPIERMIGGNGELQRALIYLRFSFGHVVPHSLGGGDVEKNIVGEHFWCNKEKKTYTNLPEEKRSWIREYARTYVPQLLDCLTEEERVC